MKQREFPWLSIVPSPKDVDDNTLRLCRTEQEAFAATLRAKGVKYTASWFAKHLGVSSAYMSQLKAGVKPIPDWMVGPLCCLAGTNLLAQYRELQAALRAVRQERTQRERVDEIVMRIGRAA